MQHLGEHNAVLKVWIGNEPRWPVAPFPAEPPVLNDQELNAIIELNSNHWRKVFNVYAKLLHSLVPSHAPDWQTVRDRSLFQKNQRHAMTLAASNITVSGNDTLALIPGKQYADSLGLLASAIEVQPGVYRHQEDNILITPYFDYRALSNERIRALAALIQKHWPDQASRVFAD